jgi:hypothetical protein
MLSMYQDKMRIKVCTLGTVLDKIMMYFTCVPKSGIHSSASQKACIDQFIGELQQILPKLEVNNMTLIQKVLSNTFLMNSH